MHFVIVPFHLSKVPRLPKKWGQVIRRAAPVTQNHLSKPEDRTLQNASPLRKSAPGPPNISDEHVSFIVPATRHASLQILFKCPTPANAFETATKPHVLLTLRKVPKPLRLPRKKNTSYLSKIVQDRQFLRLLTSKCASRHNCVHILDISTSKVLRTWCALRILTWKCALRHNALHFFNSSTSKSSPTRRCFYHFDFQMCCVPQRHALFQDSTSKNAPKLRFFFLLTSKCALYHSGVQLFISHLPRWLRTRLFSEPQNIGKHTVFRSLLPFHPYWSSFFFFLSLLWSSLFFLSLLWLFPPRLFHLPILSGVWLPNFLWLKQA